MKYLIFPLVALGLSVGLGTAAMGQPAAAPSAPKSYPPCSKSVTDECMSSSRGTMHHAAMRSAHHKMAHHHKMAAHHGMKAKHEPKPA